MTRCAIFPLSDPRGKSGRGAFPREALDRRIESAPRRLARGPLAVGLLVAAAVPGFAPPHPSFAQVPAPESLSSLAWDRYPADPGTLSPPLEFRRLAITTTDSVQIAAWYVPPQDSAGATQPGRHPGVLVLPREGETLESRLGMIAGLIHRGFAVLAVDHRGTGASGAFAADPRALVYREFLTDAGSALDILWRRPEVDTTRVAVYGESRGAVLALAAAGRRPELRAAVAVSPPYNLKTWFQALQAEHPDGGWFLPKGWERGDEPDRVMNRFNGAILFVAGDADLDTPKWMAEDLHKKYPRPKELWVIEGATHAGERSPERLLGARYYDRIASFLNRELGKKPHRGWPAR